MIGPSIRKDAKGVMAAADGPGNQLTEITSLIDDGIIHPVVDRVFPFASTKEAMAYVEAGRAKARSSSQMGMRLALGAQGRREVIEA